MPRDYGINKRKMRRAELIEDRTAERQAKIERLLAMNAATIEKREAFDLEHAKHCFTVCNGVLCWGVDTMTARAGNVVNGGCGQVRIYGYSYNVKDVAYMLEHGVWPDNLRKIPEPYVPAQRTAWNKGKVKEAGKKQRHDAYNAFLAKHGAGEPASQDDGADPPSQ